MALGGTGYGTLQMALGGTGYGTLQMALGGTGYGTLQMALGGTGYGTLQMALGGTGYGTLQMAYLGLVLCLLCFSIIKDILDWMGFFTPDHTHRVWGFRFMLHSVLQQRTLSLPCPRPSLVSLMCAVLCL